MAGVRLPISVIVIVLLALATGIAADIRFLSSSASFPPVKNATQSPNSGRSGYIHTWPGLRFGWKIVVGSIIGFIGAASGSVGGVGGGGIYVPMLTLVVGFDPKSAVALSKCMIVGAAASTVGYNLKLRHPTVEMPIIDYDLAVLIQPMLTLGISIGVVFNVIFPDWMLTVLLICIFLVISTKAFFKGVETWKKETITMQELESRVAPNRGGSEDDGEPNPSVPHKAVEEISILRNIYWRELGILFFVWLAFLAIQIAKNGTRDCSALYWVLNVLQIPVAVGVTVYEIVGLCKGTRRIGSLGDKHKNWKLRQLIMCCIFGVIAGIIGGLLGMGGGFILGPLFLELGIPPQVSSATATFAMLFSSSMSVVEYYLLKRFPVPYALYMLAVTTFAALVGQHVMRKVINMLGRASLIIFVLAATVFASAFLLGGVGITKMVHRIKHHEYMGFEDLCKYHH